jgi:hypothetical protein
MKLISGTITICLSVPGVRSVFAALGLDSHTRKWLLIAKLRAGAYFTQSDQDNFWRDQHQQNYEQS